MVQLLLDVQLKQDYEHKMGMKLILFTNMISLQAAEVE